MSNETTDAPAFDAKAPWVDPEVRAYPIDETEGATPTGAPTDAFTVTS